MAVRDVAASEFKNVHYVKPLIAAGLKMINVLENKDSRYQVGLCS